MRNPLAYDRPEDAVLQREGGELGADRADGDEPRPGLLPLIWPIEPAHRCAWARMSVGELGYFWEDLSRRGEKTQTGDEGIDFNAQIPDGALDLGMSQQQLHGT